jgi:hypothetical protein
MVKVLFGKTRKKTEQAKKVVDDPLFDTSFELYVGYLTFAHARTRALAHARTLSTHTKHTH